MKTLRSFTRTMPLFAAFMLVCAFCHSALASPTGKRAMTAAPSPPGTYVTGSLSFGTFLGGGTAKLLGASFVPSSGDSAFRRPDSAFARLELTAHNLIGPIDLTASFQQPFHGKSFWNSRDERFFAELTAPLGLGSLFAQYERFPTSGYEAANVGYRIPFKL